MHSGQLERVLGQVLVPMATEGALDSVLELLAGLGLALAMALG